MTPTTGRPVRSCARASSHAVRHGERCAHVDDRVARAVGRDGAERVAADVAGDDGLEAAQLGKDQAVRAAGAERRRARREVRGGREMRGQFHAKGGADELGLELAGHGEGAGGRLGELDAEGADVRGEVVARLLHHIAGVHGGREVGEGPCRQRPGKAELERGGLGQRLADVLVDGAGADDADLLAPHLHHVVRAGLRVLLERGLALVHHGAPLDGVGRHHDVLGDVVRVVARGHGLARAGGCHQRAGVRDAHGLVQHDRRVKALGELEGGARHLVALLRVRGVEAGDAAKGGVEARVLLVLGRVAGRVVRGQEHEAGVHAGGRGGHEGVGGHVDAHVLHRDERAHAGNGGAQGHLEGDLLVGGPLAVDVVLAHEGLEGLGGRRAGIAHAHGHAGLPGALGDGLVAGHQVLVHGAPL